MALGVELQRLIVGRRVRVFERIAGRHQRPTNVIDEAEDRVSTWISSDRSSNGGEADRSDRRDIFNGYIEVECGGPGAWLGMRVALWTSGGVNERCFRSVQGVMWYQESGRRRVASRVASRVATVREEDLEVVGGGVSQGTEGLVARVVSDVVDRFREANVQELSAMDSRRAKFEYELLQHHRELDVVVTTTDGSSHPEVLFALPLVADDDQSAHKEEDHSLDDLEGGSYLPRALRHPLVERGRNRTIISLRLANTDDASTSKQGEGDACSWDVSLSWPRDLRLSSQVTQLARAISNDASSVDIIGSCKQAFLSQWTKRRDFVGELRSKAIVLEFDPVDFSRVFFMLQEQLDPHAPLRVLVLSLTFTPEFFLTRCLADMRVRLLDGRSSSHDDGEGVAILLASHSSDSIDAWEHDTPRLVAAFLKCLQMALIQHLYES